jgi:hypothetical protein
MAAEFVMPDHKESELLSLTKAIQPSLGGLVRNLRCVVRVDIELGSRCPANLHFWSFEALVTQGR